MRICLLMAFVCVLSVSAGCGYNRIGARANVAQSVKNKDLETLKSELVDLKGQVALKVEEIKVKRQELIKNKLYWVSGIAMLCLLGCVALAVFVPGARKLAVYGALACIAIAGVAWLAAWLVPYLIWIGAGVAVVLIGAAVYWWRLDAKSRDQVVQAVESVKADLPDYKGRFRQFIDYDVDRALDKARKRLT